MFSDGQTEILTGILSRHFGGTPKHILVVGCGDGLEARILAEELKARVTGIDLPQFGTIENLQSRYAEPGRVDLEEGDATAMRFPDASFDVVYSYHALEHIPEYRKALAEMYRVLEPGGTFFIGAPNRLRLFAYFGAKQGRLTLREKIAHNLTDWRQKLTGRFRNELGAHAGFGTEALRRESAALFGEAHDMATEYYMARFTGHRRLIQFLAWSRLATIAYPSIFLVGRKTR